MSKWTWDSTLDVWTCPLCMLTWSDTFDFISRSLHAWGTEESARQAWAARGGFCPCHLEEVRRLSSPQNLCLMYGALTARALEVLMTTREAHAPEAIAALATAVDCPACEVRGQSEARHTADLLERLNDATFRERYRASCGLCLPHLTNVLRAAENGEQRTFLIESQREQLKRLQADLAGYYEKRTMLRRDAITQAEYAAAKTAVEKFSSMHGQTPVVICETSAVV